MQDLTPTTKIYLDIYRNTLQKCYGPSFIKSWMRSVGLHGLNYFFSTLITLPMLAFAMLSGALREMLPNHPKIIGLLYITWGIFTAYGYFRAFFWFQTHRTTKIYNPVYGYGSMYQSMLLSQLNFFPAVLSVCTGVFAFFVANMGMQKVFSVLCGLVAYTVTNYALFRLYRPLLTVSDQDALKTLVESKNQDINTEYFAESFLKFIFIVFKNMILCAAAIVLILSFLVMAFICLDICLEYKNHAPLMIAYALSLGVMTGLICIPFLIQKFYTGGVVTFVYRWSYRNACLSPFLALFGLSLSALGFGMFTQLSVLSVILCVILYVFGAYKIFQYCKKSIRLSQDIY